MDKERLCFVLNEKAFGVVISKSSRSHNVLIRFSPNVAEISIPAHYDYGACTTFSLLASSLLKGESL